VKGCAATLASMPLPARSWPARAPGTTGQSKQLPALPPADCRAEASAVSATGRSNLGAMPPPGFLKSLERGTLTILIRGQEALAERRFRTAHEPSSRPAPGVPAVQELDGPRPRRAQHLRSGERTDDANVRMPKLRHDDHKANTAAMMTVSESAGDGLSAEHRRALTILAGSPADAPSCSCGRTGFGRISSLSSFAPASPRRSPAWCGGPAPSRSESLSSRSPPKGGRRSRGRATVGPGSSLHELIAGSRRCGPAVIAPASNPSHASFSRGRSPVLGTQPPCRIRWRAG
jgi:hypothetical protein